MGRSTEATTEAPVIGALSVSSARIFIGTPGVRSSGGVPRNESSVTSLFSAACTKKGGSGIAAVVAG